MNGVNPYNYSMPGNLFTGYAEEIRQVTEGFRNGKSFAILGGNRCGKTSFLLEVEKWVGANGVPGHQPLLRLIDLGGQVPHSPFDFFAALYRAVVKDCGAEAWESAPGAQPYREFLRRMEAAVPAIEKKHGPDWLAILLIDKLDLAKGEDRLDLAKGSHAEVFQNLRNLLQLDPLRGRFRLVGTGGSDMYSLVTESSPLANILDTVWLRPFTEVEADGLIVAGGLSMADDLRRELLELSGRHAFILQGLLARLWESRDSLKASSVREAAQQFSRNRGTVFQHWARVLGPERMAVYQAIAASDGKATVAELRRRSKVTNIDEPLRVLSFHGVIDDAEDSDRPKIAGTIFRDWVRRNAGIEGEPAAEVKKPRRFSVAFSFAGETRDRVKRIASLLAQEVTRARVLYDEFYEAEFAMIGLNNHLQRLYHDESELILVVICEQYESKPWTGLEWRAIQDLIHRKQSDRIMLFRTDDATLPGVFAGDGYVDLRKRTDEQAVALILQRLRSRQE